MRKLQLSFFLVILALLLCGCADASIDELYSLPKTQVEFQQLQALIENEIKAGSEYSAPTAGTKRPSVQLVDINGDSQSEAIAFLKNPSSVPTICIYRVVSGQYELATTITGEGSAIGRVEYEDLDGDGNLEIIVAWKMSTGLATVKAYSLRDWTSAVLLSVSCTDFRVYEFGSFNGTENAGMDVAVLNTGEEGGTVDVYFTDSAGEMTLVSAKLSASLTSAERFRAGSLKDGTPAVFVEGYYKDEETTYYLTDVLAYSPGALKNITLDKATGNSFAIRSSEVYCLDIDNDGCFEVPFAQKVYSQPEVSADYYVFDWYSFTAAGDCFVSASTYHCYSDGWYYELPEEWREGFTVRRETDKSGERTVVLSTFDEKTKTVTDRLVIYTLTGENRNERASLPSRFVLASSETTIYAATLYKTGGAELTDEEKGDVTARFHIITSEWTTGAV